jgi:hypothetical protein
VYPEATEPTVTFKTLKLNVPMFKKYEEIQIDRYMDT